MKEIIAGSELYVGSAESYEKHLGPYIENDTWALWSVVHAAKEPYHRQALGYPPGKAAPKGNEYLFAFRGDRLFLNMIDVDNPAFIAREMVDAAIGFMEAASLRKRKVLIHCNEGRSRAPTLMMLLIAPMLPADFTDAEAQFKTLYPDYAPKNGVRTYAMANWDRYRARDFGRAA